MEGRSLQAQGVNRPQKHYKSSRRVQDGAEVGMKRAVGCRPEASPGIVRGRTEVANGLGGHNFPIETHLTCI